MEDLEKEIRKVDVMELNGNRTPENNSSVDLSMLKLKSPFIQKLFKHLTPLTKQDIFHACILVTVFNFYPDLASLSIGLFDCQKLFSKSLDTYMTGEYSLVCWEGTHLFLFLATGIPMLVFIVIGVPIYLFFASQILYKRQIRLQEKGHHGLDEKNVVNKFIDNYYTNGHYYWETVVYFQKFIFAFTLVVIHHSPTAVVCPVMILILLGFYFLVLRCQPVHFKKCNRIEARSYAALIGTLIIRYITAGDVSYSKSLSYTLLSVSSVINMIFLGDWAVAYLRAFYKEKIKKGIDDCLLYTSPSPRDS
eukprot:TRINITY_DN15603_c0_g1_i1.p1 TRINITY_DN15603_c0_g1~~TRINITY_DN15603_c0_g1_i1.p1  ORF type:complete len:306 (+),score=20.17 TRINITY_DN15603_c0_g1_i1:117-1034(+)